MRKRNDNFLKNNNIRNKKNFKRQPIIILLMRKTQIAVIGYNEDWCTDVAKTIAYDVGKEIAISGSVLICGGLGGVMESAEV
ncbi:MAG: hypothetical protein K0S93_1414 [Nitrososphaeraceae archaeon]|nr:hypothetical protein [Nitrososphaeraceae archaeon]